MIGLIQLPSPHLADFILKWFLGFWVRPRRALILTRWLNPILKGIFKALLFVWVKIAWVDWLLLVNGEVRRGFVGYLFVRSFFFLALLDNLELLLIKRDGGDVTGYTFLLHKGFDQLGISVLVGVWHIFHSIQMFSTVLQGRCLWWSYCIRGHL